MEMDKLSEILEQHRLWLVDNKTGKRADLARANLSGICISNGRRCQS